MEKRNNNNEEIFFKQRKKNEMSPSSVRLSVNLDIRRKKKCENLEAIFSHRARNNRKSSKTFFFRFDFIYGNFMEESLSSECVRNCVAVCVKKCFSTKHHLQRFFPRTFINRFSISFSLRQNNHFSASSAHQCNMKIRMYMPGQIAIVYHNVMECSDWFNKK